MTTPAITLPAPPEYWCIERLTAERTEAIAAFGFTERQARFLVEVLIHSGVFVERQYCTYAGIAHGQKTTDFLRTLVERGHARPIEVGARHRGRLFHLCHKPLYAAVGQADNRHRRRMPLGRMIERLMVLDAVLADRTLNWLGTESDKRNYFMRELQGRVELREFPRLMFGAGARSTTRYFPDKLPIGIQRDKWDEHVFLYLVTSPVPMDFRLFLLRHGELLRSLLRWRIRVLVPEPFARAIRQFGHAAREQLATPVPPASAEELEWLFRERQRRQEGPPEPPDDRFRRAVSMFRAPRFRALYRFWQQEGNTAGWTAQSHTLRDALTRQEGRVEFVRLGHQYFHLASLVGVA